MHGRKAKYATTVVASQQRVSMVHILATYIKLGLL